MIIDATGSTGGRPSNLTQNNIIYIYIYIYVCVTRITLTYFNIRLKYNKKEKGENTVDKGRLEVIELDAQSKKKREKKKNRCPPSDIDAPSRIFVHVVSS